MFRYAGEMLRLPEKSDDSAISVLRYDCDLCDDGGWGSETELVIHRTSKHRQELRKRSFQNSKKQPVCRICIERYETSTALLEHIKSDHLFSSPTARRIEREIFICELCSQIFFHKGLLELHMVHKHMQVRPVPCPVCPKDMHRKAMWTHLESHQLRSVSTCPICLKKRKSWSDLKQHIQSHNKYYYCDACGYRTYMQQNFKEHIEQYRLRDSDVNKEIDHRKVFLFPLPDKLNFIRHVLKGLVMMNQIFICILCRELCTSKRGMVKHIKKVHMSTPHTIKTETKHTCVCGEEFQKGIFLKVHLLKSGCGKESAKNSPPPNEEAEATEMEC